MEVLRDTWRGRWNEALGLWSRWTRLSEPRFCLTTQEAVMEGLTRSFAMIRLVDHAVVLDLEAIVRCRLDDFPVEVMGHEVGHHILCPGDLTDHARMLARMRRGLPGQEAQAPLVGNLYGDLLINDRLQRIATLRMAQIYQRLGSGSTDPLWLFYMRIYEVLWNLPRRTLALGDTTEEMELDAWLGARLIRSYAADWLRGSGRFAMLVLPYLEHDGGEATRRILQDWLDTEGGQDGIPDGLTEIEDDEIDGAIHPRLDPELSGVPAEKPASGPPAQGGGGGGQTRSPFEYGQLLKALGVKLDDQDIAVRYYRERSTSYLVPFPTRRAPESTEPMPEGVQAWDIGSPLEDIDWLESLVVSPRPVPGVTTRQRVYGTVAGAEPAREPVDLDLYIDCSGSMPDPRRQESFLALAGTIMARSALRVGAAVQATLWSGPGQFWSTRGFVRDETDILRIVTGYLDGGTAFPLHVLRDTYGKPRKRKVHIMVVSDDGVDTMLQKDEKGRNGLDIATAALLAAGGGGSMVLQLGGGDHPRLRPLQPLFDIYPVREWNELLAFARAFSRKTYGGP
ncbi:MAG TPA: VWA domain-containing protein [Candidatus Xenobia bacterium]|jgi:hypothetical protein